MQILADIEVYYTHFMLGIKDYQTKETRDFQIGIRDDRLKLFEFLRDFKGFWVTFNGVRYDNIVLAYGQMNKWWPMLSVEQVCYNLKKFSDTIIYAEDDEFHTTFKKYKYYFKWTDIDLYLYWSKLLRLSRKISLKSLGIQLGYPVVQELPFDPSMRLTNKQWQEVVEYNLVHDLGILDLLIIEMKDDILLRQLVSQESGLNLWSADAPKIASELLLQDYCKQTGLNPNEVRKYRYEKPTISFAQLFQQFDPCFQTVELQNLYKELLNQRDSFSKNIILWNKDDSGVKISIAEGGIHSINENEQYWSNEDYIICDSDVAAMYSALIINLGTFRFSEVNRRYKEIRDFRSEVSKPNFKKAKKDGDHIQTQHWKLQDEFYKLCLNSTSGLIDMSHSWLYNPEAILKLRIMGQLILLRCTEAAQLKGWKVFYLNTDGLSCIIPRKDYEEYQTTINNIGKEFNLDFEHEVFKSIHYQNVNSYIGITEYGIIKKKGQFVTKPVLSTSVDFLIIPKLLQCYFVDGIKPETILSQLDTFEYNWDGKMEKLHIYLFCASQKVDKSYSVEWNGKKQQRLNRYFVSRRGAYLYKCRDGKKSHLIKNYGVTIYNRHIDQPLSFYDLDMKFYLQKTWEIINNIQRNNQLTLL